MNHLVKAENASTGEIITLVTIIDGEPRTTTLVIAEGTNNDHASVIKLVRTYLSDFQEFGEVGFQIRLNLQGSPTEYAILNEEQSALLISYMRNTEIVRSFKKNLIRSFSIMKRQLQAMIPQTLPEALRLAADLAEENGALKCQMAIAAPKAAIADRLAGAEGNLNVRNSAKALKMKEHRFTEWLQIKKLAFRDKKGKLVGYADHVPRYLDHKVQPIPCDGDPDRVSFQLMVTPAGLVKFAKMLNVELHEQDLFAEAA